jgi:outer membrane protein OmpA-like peptidoglycan-associated protein
MPKAAAVSGVAALLSKDHGQALPAALRSGLEGHFGHDFSSVRVHADDAAARSAQALSAAAFTLGSDIVFGTGRYAPETAAGRRLLGHELAHVVQQDTGRVAAGTLQRQPLTLGGGLAAGNDEAALRWESYRQSITLDAFDSDKAVLQPDHLTRLAEYKQRLQTMLGRYPDSFITVIGHTDATDSEAHNKVLGQQRADAVKAALSGGDNALPAALIHAGSLGETVLAVETQAREARNRRVEVIPTLRRGTTLPPSTVPDAGNTTTEGRGTATEDTQEGGTDTGPTRPDPGSVLPGGRPKVPDLRLPRRNWFKEGLKNDPIVKSLPDWARKKVIDALEDGDEMLAEKVVDALPLDDKAKAAVQAIVKSLLKLAKGQSFTMPESPPPGRDPLPKTEFPKSPGQVIIPGPVWHF